MSQLKIKILIISFMIPLSVMAQSGEFKLGWWNHQSLNGSVQLEGLYRSQETILNNSKSEKPKTFLYNGELQLHSKSFFWHPNFMLLNMDLNYSPGTRRDNFLVIPDRTETHTAEQFRISSVFFNERPLSFDVFANWNHNYINREFASNVESYNRDWGAGVAYRNSFLPVTVNYTDAGWEQKELQNGRVFKNDKNTLRTELSKSFSTFDDHRFMYAYNDYRRQYSNTFTVNNYAASYRLLDNFYFDDKRQSSFNSLVWYYDQTGDDPFSRLQLNERFRVKLPANVKTSGYYNFSDFKQRQIESKQHKLLGRVEHQLYLSLKSFAWYEYSDFQQTTYDETINKYGLGFDYRKKIPTGSLKLSYEYRHRFDKQSSDPRQLFIVDEEQQLADNSVVLLDNPFVDPASVTVTNEDGTIIFQENLDYLIIERNGFLEIQRLPGGQISEGETVYVDYTTTESASFQFDAINQNIFTSITLWDNFFEGYFRYYDQSNENIRFRRNLVIKNIVQRVSGLRLSHKFISAGFEYEDYASNIVPYFSRRYFLKINHTFNNRLSAFLTGNIRNYHLKDAHESQDFSDISARVIYFLTRATQLKFEGGYRVQNGRGLDLTLLNFRTELATRFRSVVLKAGLESYNRDFSGEEVNYMGGYLRVERYF